MSAWGRLRAARGGRAPSIRSGASFTWNLPCTNYTSGANASGCSWPGLVLTGPGGEYRLCWCAGGLRSWRWVA
eukprot:5846941-Alexandrium_andersonii.AAC.1